MLVCNQTLQKSHLLDLDASANFSKIFIISIGLLHMDIKKGNILYDLDPLHFIVADYNYNDKHIWYYVTVYLIVNFLTVGKPFAILLPFAFLATTI